MLKTTETLLQGLAANNQTRWAKFYGDYAPWIENLLRQKGLCTADAEDILHETLIDLVRIMPTYRYDPDSKGSFHSLIFKIAQNKTVDLFRRQGREQAHLAAMSADLANVVSEEDWRRETFNMALRRVFADPTIRETSKIAFRRVVQQGEDAATVARELGLETNAVYQIRSRMKERLSDEIRKIQETSPDGV